MSKLTDTRDEHNSLNRGSIRRRSELSSDSSVDTPRPVGKKAPTASANSTPPILNMADDDAAQNKIILATILDKLNSVQSEMKTMSQDLSFLKASSLMIEQKCDLAHNAAKQATEKVKEFDTEMKRISSENKDLKEKLSKSESYSKKNNLIFHNIQEDAVETSSMLINKVGHVVRQLGLNIYHMYVDNIHRLPGPKGKRPIIVKFVSFLDRDAIWKRRTHLKDVLSKVVIRDHQPAEIERSVRRLLPIRRAAIDQGKRVTLDGETLIIEGKKYSVNTLDTLPVGLRPIDVAVRKEGEYLFYFSQDCPMSNFFPSEFVIDSIKYSCSEQFLQACKADTFNDKEAMDKIMKATSPNAMRAIGKTVDIDLARWHDVAPGLIERAIIEKFSQNKELTDYLEETHPLKLVEAAPSDSFWGIGRSVYDKENLKFKHQWGKNFMGQILMKARAKVMEE
jgi:ribA/ribD-fused uncharacterized protein